MKAETPATSDVESALDQAAQEYISLLIGLVNSPPKLGKGAEAKDAGKGDEVEELAQEMESDTAGLSPSSSMRQLPAGCAAPVTLSCFVKTLKQAG